MAEDLPHRITSRAREAAGLYHRLVLVVGPPRTGKTIALRALAEKNAWPLINVNLALSERLLELTSKQRAIKVPALLGAIADEHSGDVILLDNTEILFSRDLRQDPLRLLQKLARNRTVIAAWSGQQQGDQLTYAEPSHSESRRYSRPDAVIVSVQDTHEEKEEA